MIRQMSFTNFEALREVSTSLERFTVLVGPNASGKSSILQGIHLLCEAARWVDSRYREGIDPSTLVSFVSHGTTGNLVLEYVEDHGGFRLQVDRALKDGRPSSESWTLEGKDSPEMPEWQPFERGHFIPTSLLLRLEAAILAQPSYTPAITPRLGSAGEGLHSVLAYLALNQPDTFGDLQETLTRIIPTIRRVRFGRTQVQQVLPVPIPGEDRGQVRYERRDYTTDMLLFDTVAANAIPAQLASEGTLQVLGILAALYCPPRPQILLLDDLDRGLHPRAQLDLVSYLRNLLETQPELQIIATTHSPYILDRLTSDEVRLVTLGDDGWAICGQLRDHPKFERWKEEMTPGEFWMMFGEKWLNQGVQV